MIGAQADFDLLFHLTVKHVFYLFTAIHFGGDRFRLAISFSQTHVRSMIQVYEPLLHHICFLRLPNQIFSDEEALIFFSSQLISLSFVEGLSQPSLQVLLLSCT